MLFVTTLYLTGVRFVGHSLHVPSLSYVANNWCTMVPLHIHRYTSGGSVPTHPPAARGLTLRLEHVPDALGSARAPPPPRTAGTDLFALATNAGGGIAGAGAGGIRGKQMHVEFRRIAWSNGSTAPVVSDRTVDVLPVMELILPMLGPNDAMEIIIRPAV